MSPDPLGGCPNNPQSLDGYTYVLNDPATLVDPTGRFIDESADCLEDPFLAECQCDPVNGCPPDVLLLAPPRFIYGVIVTNLLCHSTTEKPVFAHCPYICEGEGGSTVTLGVHDLSEVELIRACGPIAQNSCPRYVHLTVTDTVVFGIGISQKVTIRGCAN